MTAGDLRTTSVAMVALAATVALNLFALQDGPADAAVVRASMLPRSFEATVAAALNDLGPAAVPGSAVLRLQPPKPTPEMVANTAEIIRGVQRELNTRGYEAGQPDGVAGLVTRAAIMAYEHDYGLPLTAMPTQELLSRIVLGSSQLAAHSAAADRIAAAEAEGVALSVEQQLTELGYKPGKADGKISDETAHAIRDFEVAQKLPASGRISGQLVSRLLRLQGIAAAQAVSQAGSKAQPQKIKSAQK